MVQTAFAQDAGGEFPVAGESFVPTIWIDPDGCEHWVMDTGSQGFMDANRRPDGSAVCHRREACAMVFSDYTFPKGGHTVGAKARKDLKSFFASSDTFGFLIYGHTDNSGPDETNMELSQKRAEAVSKIAQESGANVVEIRGFGERDPRANNATAEGRAENRRVEVYCLR